MEESRTVLPLVVTASSGSGGVSPAFSILPDRIAKHTEALGQAVIALISPPAANDTGRFSDRLEQAAQSVSGIYEEVNATAQSMNAVIAESVRMNVEQGLRFLEDLAAAKAPADALKVQFAYFTKQLQLLTGQAHEFQAAFARNLASLRAGAEAPR